jgi:4-amino-4-deoxy-L-arabinose transferase-like glycosyltransferase
VAAGFYKLFGFGVWQTRIHGLLFGAADLFMISLLAWRLFEDSLAAAFAAAILGLHPAFVATARAGRMDTECLFFVLLATTLYLEGQWRPSRTYLWYGASGLSLGLAGMFHAIAAAWAPALGLLVLLNGGKGRFCKLGWLALCASLFPLLWLGWALRTPDQFRLQFLSHAMAHLAEGTIVERLGGEIYFEVGNHLRVPTLLAAYAGGAIWGLFFALLRREVKVILAVLCSVPLLLIAIFMVKEAGPYFLYPVTALTLCAGFLLARLWKAGIASTTRWSGAILMSLPVLLLANLFAAGLGGRWLLLAWQYRERDYQQVEVPVRAIIPKGSIVLGPAQAWYALVGVGASLRLRSVNFDFSHPPTQPNPRVHDFVIREVSKPLDEDLTGFHEVQRIGAPLPPLFGRFRVSESSDYQLEIWKSDFR